jgi:CSLREA domain-containing protein
MFAKRTLARIIFVFVTFISLFFTSLGTTPAYAAAITVNTNADNVANDGFCTLREAIATANDDSAIYPDPIPGECAVGFGADSISFAGNYTITLAGAHLPMVTSKIFISGNGAANTIIQANASPETATFRIFTVSGSSAELVLYRLTVRHGRCNGECAINGLRGGAIYNNYGTLTVADSIISENSGGYGGAIFNQEGSLTVINSTLSGNNASYTGGGIYSTFNNDGRVTVTNSTIARNTAVSSAGGIFAERGHLDITDSTITENNVTRVGSGAGGGIYTFAGSITITNSIISNNSVLDGRGGGIYNVSNGPGFLTITNSTISGNYAGGSALSGSGGGIFNHQDYYSRSTITNSTISGNSASSRGGGIYNSGESPNINFMLDITNSTISGNSATNQGGGIFNNAALIYRNTIIANSLFGGDCYSNNLTFSGNSLVEDGSCSANLSGDPKLGPLANNGGFTQTHALLSGSPAIDAVTSCTNPYGNPLTQDQRGVTRPQGTHCDIGAFELEQSSDTLPPVVTSVTRVDPNPTAAASVDFLVTFSESVTGVDAVDFVLISSGVTNEAINGVTGAGAQYTVTVATGSGDGTIRLDVVDDDSILDAAGNPLGGVGAGNGNFSSGEVYDIQKNDAPTDIQLSAATIAENLPAGTTVGTLTTIDPDLSDTHTYSFCNGADDASFVLAGNTLNTAAMFDYEVQSTFNICIRSTDAGGQFIDKAFQVFVQDVAETLAPETRIIKLKAKRGVYTFFFTSSVSDSTFMCRLDQDAFVPCTNPTRYSGLSAGSHTFQVYAIDPFGNPDLTPAEYHFTIDQ